MSDTDAHADGDAEEFPIDVTAGEAGPHATEAFALLGNEVRLAILLALWEAYDPHAADNAVAFSELFERVDYDDPGSFRYHLRQLRGQFVSQPAAGEGYALTVAGRRVVQTVIAGSGVTDAALPPTVIAEACPFCAAPTTIAYRDGLVVHRCTACPGAAADDGSGFLSAVPLDPAGLTDRRPEAVRAASRVAAWRQTQFMLDGLCPACSGPVDGRLACCPDHDPSGVCARCGTRFSVLARFECRVCKNHNVSAPAALALFHPAVVGFYDRHGVPVQFDATDHDQVGRIVALMAAHEVDRVAADPPRVAVTARRGDDAVQLTFDETASVVAVDRDPGE